MVASFLRPGSSRSFPHVKWLAHGKQSLAMVMGWVAIADEMYGRLPRWVKLCKEFFATTATQNEGPMSNLVSRHYFGDLAEVSRNREAMGTVWGRGRRVTIQCETMRAGLPDLAPNSSRSTPCP